MSPQPTVVDKFSYITPPPDQAFAFGIWETRERLTSIPSIWKCGTAKSLTRKKRIVLYVLDDNFPVAQWMRSLKFIARIGHFRHQRADPGVKLQFQHAAVFGGADILALNNFQVVSNADSRKI